jgi:hypothetical protein
MHSNCAIRSERIYVVHVFRARASVLPAPPTSLSALTLEPPWSLTADGRQTILVEDGTVDKIVTFYTDDNLRRTRMEYFSRTV